jgi:hypothetical protein
VLPETGLAIRELELSSSRAQVGPQVQTKRANALRWNHTTQPVLMQKQSTRRKLFGLDWQQLKPALSRAPLKSGEMSPSGLGSTHS